MPPVNRRSRKLRRSQAEFFYKPKGKPKRREYATLDFETKAADRKHAGFDRPFLLGFYDGEKHREFRNDRRLGDKPRDVEQHALPGGCVDTFGEWLFHTKDGLQYTRDKFFIYAHAGGSFDWKFLLGWIERQPDLEYKIVPTMNRIQELVVSVVGAPESHKWSFRDSASLFSGKLADLANAYGVGSKLVMNFEADEEDPEWSVYNGVDCKVLYDVLMKFRDIVENVLGGEVRISAAATALTTWQRKFQDKPLKRSLHEPTCDKRRCKGCLHKWVAQAYYGGRTEVLIPRGRDLRYYDANAAYSYACTFPMPVGDVTVLNGPEEHERWMADFVNTRVGFVEATVEIPDKCEIPPLPIRHEGKLKFGTGVIRGVWDAEELRLLFHPMVGGRIIEVHKSAWYEARPVLRSFMEKLYPMRLEEKILRIIIEKGDASPEDVERHAKALATSDVAKNLANALYGKFGTKPDRRNFIRLAPGMRPPEGAIPLIASDGNDYESQVWTVPYRMDAPYIMPQLAAHVAALARVALFLATVQVRQLGGNVYYLGTDAIGCDVDLPESLDLGKLRRENPGMHFQSARFVRSMDYRMKGDDGTDKIRLKGVPLRMAAQGEIKIHRADGRRVKSKSAIQVFEALENGATIEFERQEQFLGMLRRMAKSPNEPATPMTRTVRRAALNCDDKRKWLPNGSTRPWIFGLDAEGKVTSR